MMKQVLVLIVASIIASLLINTNEVEGLKLTMFSSTGRTMMRGASTASKGVQKVYANTEWAPIDTRGTFVGSHMHPRREADYQSMKKTTFVEKKHSESKAENEEKKHVISEIKEGLKGKSYKEAAALGYESAQCAGYDEQKSRMAGHLMGGIVSQTVDEVVGQADPTSFGVLSKILYSHAVIFRAGSIALPPVCPQVVAAKSALAGASVACVVGARGCKYLDNMSTKKDRAVEAGKVVLVGGNKQSAA